MKWSTVGAIIGAVVALVIAWWLIGWLWHLMWLLAKFGVAAVFAVIVFFLVRRALRGSRSENS